MIQLRFFITLLLLASSVLGANMDPTQAIEDLQLNIKILREQFDYTASELHRMKSLLPKDLGLYEGQLVGKYELEQQIRKQETKLSVLKQGEDASAEAKPYLKVSNDTPLKLLVTLISEDPGIDQTDYFLFQEMEIEIPVEAVNRLQISDYREDNIYPIYQVDSIDAHAGLVLKLHGGEYRN